MTLAAQYGFGGKEGVYIAHCSSIKSVSITPPSRYADPQNGGRKPEWKFYKPSVFQILILLSHI